MAPKPEVGMPIKNMGSHSGETSLISPDKPKTIAQMAKIFGIDLKVWIPESIRTNEWQGFYKADKTWSSASTNVNGSSKTKHKKVALWQTRITWKRIVPAPLHQGIVAFAKENVKPISALPRWGSAKDPFAVAWGLWDAHLGMYAWAEEVGQSFDLNMGVNRVMNSVDDMVDELRNYPISKIWMPVGNDFMHFDNAQLRTTRGEHSLDTDTRYAKVWQAALSCLAYMVERGSEIAHKVEIIHVPGNHDYTSSFTLCAALAQRYRECSNVKVDAGANPRKYRTHGGVLLGFDHGETSADQLSRIFPTECVKEWSKSTYREMQVGHTHQRSEKMFNNLVPTNGVLVRTNPSLCNVDSWHHKQGFIGEPMKSVEAYRYDKTGFRGSHVAWARDDKRT